MSAAAAPTATAGASPSAKGKKKLLVIILAVVLLVLIGGGAAVFFLKKKAHDAEASEETASGEHGSSAAAAKPDLKHPPTFLPLDPFVINLADKEVDRYAQIGITLEVADAHFAEEMKAFMPAIRNGILMILSHKSSKDLLDREGKQQLADEILRDASRTMGIEIDEPEADSAAAAPADADADSDKPKPKKKKKKAASEPNPIKHVHFSNFIIQ